MIFNKTENGSLELKELIGFIYKSINFNNLKSYIEFAERNMKKIIGIDVFAQAENHYNSENYLLAEADEDHPEYTLLDELVAKIQYPVAVYAYRRYVPSADLTHSDKGRQIFVSEQEKPAFEWQIEKDNENLLFLEHQAIDILLEWLDSHIDFTIEGDIAPFFKWSNTAAYLATKDLFINTVGEFEKVFLIEGSRFTFLSLAPFIRRVQENEILAAIGQARYDALTQAIVDMAETEEPAKTLLDKIRPPLVLLALSVAAKRLSSQVLPSGIFTGLVSNVIRGKNPASKQDRNEIAVSLEKDGMRELGKLQEHIRKQDMLTSGETYIAVDPSASIDETLKFVRL